MPTMHVAFLDRDGTLIYEPPDGQVRVADFRILPGVIETLKQLKDDGFTLVMITNQNDCTGKNLEEFTATQEMLFAELKTHGMTFDHVFMCPHSEEAHCNCRKPKTGMVDAFLQDYPIDREQSFVVGDREEADGGLAKNIGVAYYPSLPHLS